MNDRSPAPPQPQVDFQRILTRLQASIGELHTQLAARDALIEDLTAEVAELRRGAEADLPGE